MCVQGCVPEDRDSPLDGEAENQNFVSFILTLFAEISCLMTLVTVLWGKMGECTDSWVDG